MNTSEVLYEAADIIEKRGWARGTDGMLVGPGPKCIEGAIMAASGGPTWQGGRKYHYNPGGNVKRVSMTELERLAFASRAEIEFDNEESLAVLTVGRSMYYAVIPPAVERAS